MEYWPVIISKSEIRIEHSEFAYNGAGDGFSHNLYINHVKSLVFQYNYTHHPFYGHALKSRALTNIIIYNRITDEDGDASYEIDIPNGGPCLIMGNIIQQSRFGENNSIISYAREGLTNPGPHNLFFIHNTVVNNKDRGIALNVQSNIDTVLNINNVFAGPMTILTGIPKTYIPQSNSVHDQLDYFSFISKDTYDYHLTSKSPGIDSAMKLKRSYLNYSLVPLKEYLHPLTWKMRFNDDKPDIGAYELQQITGSKRSQEKFNRFYYNDKTKQFIIDTDYLMSYSGAIHYTLFTLQGAPIHSENVNDNGVVHLENMTPGGYVYTLRIGQNLYSGFIVVSH
jgi:hypothetical protein